MSNKKMASADAPDSLFLWGFVFWWGVIAGVEG